MVFWGQFLLNIPIYFHIPNPLFKYWGPCNPPPLDHPVPMPMECYLMASDIGGGWVGTQVDKECRISVHFIALLKAVDQGGV